MKQEITITIQNFVPVTELGEEESAYPDSIIHNGNRYLLKDYCGNSATYEIDNKSIQHVTKLEAFKNEFEAIQTELLASLDAIKVNNTDENRHRYHVARANCMELFWKGKDNA